MKIDEGGALIYDSFQNPRVNQAFAHDEEKRMRVS